MSTGRGGVREIKMEWDRIWKSKKRVKNKGEKAWKTESQKKRSMDMITLAFVLVLLQTHDQMLHHGFVFVLSMKIVCRILSWPLLWPHYLSCVTALIFSIDHIRCSCSRNEKKNLMHYSNTHCTSAGTPGWPNQCNFVKSLYLLGIILRQKNIKYTTAVHVCAPSSIFRLIRIYRRIHPYTHPSVHKPDPVSSATDTV